MHNKIKDKNPFILAKIKSTAYRFSPSRTITYHTSINSYSIKFLQCRFISVNMLIQPNQQIDSSSSSSSNVSCTKRKTKQHSHTNIAILSDIHCIGTSRALWMFFHIVSVCVQYMLYRHLLTTIKIHSDYHDK